MEHFQGKNIGWVRVNHISFIAFILFLKNNVDSDKLASDEPTDQDIYCSSSKQVTNHNNELTSFNRQSNSDNNFV